MLFDSHAHLNFIAYNNDLDEVIKRTQKQGVFVINVGSKYENSKKAIEIARKYEGMYATIGLHPIHLRHEFFKVKKDLVEEAETELKEDKFDYEKYKELALSAENKVVAIGEVGLDYYYKPKSSAKKEAFKEMQKNLLFEQLKLAKELDLPIAFHCRMAHHDLISILKGNTWIRGVVHCFTGNLEEAKQYLNLGLYLGFNGIIFKLNLDEVIKQTPLDRILVETDCPYLTPPEAGVERNEPIFVKYVAGRIAKLKNITIDEGSGVTTANAKKLFKI